MQLRFAGFPTTTVARGMLLGAASLLFAVSSVPPVLADPPPWAPAWGYRAKHIHGYEEKYEYKSNGKHGYEEKYKYKYKSKGKGKGKGKHEDEGKHEGWRKFKQRAVIEQPVVALPAPAANMPPFDIGLGGCNRELLAGLLGAAGGGFLGAQIGDGRGQLAAVAGGTLLGYLIGGSVGRSMDTVDQNCVGQAMEHAEDGQTIAWDNPNNGGQYQVVPQQTIDRGDGRYCREYTAASTIGGQVQQTYGTACRQPDGSWELQG